MKSTNETSKTSRREFVKQSSLMAGGLMAAPLVSNAGYFNSVDDTIKDAVDWMRWPGYRCCYASFAYKTKCKAGRHG